MSGHNTKQQQKQPAKYNLAWWISYFFRNSTKLKKTDEKRNSIFLLSSLSPVVVSLSCWFQTNTNTQFAFHVCL